MSPSGRAVSAGILFLVLAGCSKPSSPTAPRSGPPVSCPNLSLSVEPSVFGFAGGEAMLAIGAPSSDCAWQLSFSSAWLGGVPAAGVGSITVPVTVPPTSEARFGSIAFNSNYVEIVQRSDQPTSSTTFTCKCSKTPPGVYQEPACGVEIMARQLATFAVFADLSAAGGPSVRSLRYVNTTGGALWNLDYSAPLTPGTYNISFYVIDGLGQVTPPVVCQWPVGGV